MKFGRLELIVFIVGMAILIVEIAGARLVAPYLGNTIFTWTSIISVVLGALAVGYYLGGRIADRRPDIRIMSIFIFASALFIAVTPIFSSNVLVAISVFLGFEYGPLAAAIILFAVPNVLLGMVSPFSVRLKVKGVKMVGEGAGNLYAIATFGGIVGALLTGYVLVPGIGLRDTFIFTAIALVIAGLIAFGKRGIPILALMIAISLFPAIPAPNLYQGSVIYQTDTPYYHLQVLNSSGRLLLVTDLSLQTIQYQNYTNASSYYEYQRLLYDGKPDVSSALYLGLGGGAMAEDLYRNSTANMDIVEIDPVVIQVAERYFGLNGSSGRVHLYNQDARFYLGNTTKKYDMIVLDTYGSAFSIPYQLTTVEAANEIKAHLDENGSLFINVLSPLAGNGSGAFRALYKTYGSVFPNLYVFALNPENQTQLQNVIIIASTDKQRYSAQYFAEIFNSTLGANQTALLMSKYYPQQINTTGYPILTDDKNPIDLYVAQDLSNTKI
ncbi:MAG: fused MFS/spermidine synthase [Candidatus Micrarchaeota archaeon]|nr:fused MFS/spermidine synthase [Candidatus Micrarchaeota archaeon]